VGEAIVIVTMLAVAPAATRSRTEPLIFLESWAAVAVDKTVGGAGLGADVAVTVRASALRR
jgi:hypothetical protein